jgi:hypothetical protein
MPTPYWRGPGSMSTMSTSHNLVSWKAVLSAHVQNGLVVDTHLGTRDVGLYVEQYMRERINGMVNYSNKTFNRLRLLRRKNIVRENVRE